RLKLELEQKTKELEEQTEQVKKLEISKQKAGDVAVRRDRSLQELMEKNRARYERANLELQEEVKSLGLLKTAADGFEEAKKKLDLAEAKSSELEKEASSLKDKVKDLDEKLAASVDKSVEEALLLVSKEAALKEVEAQLAAAEERSKRFEQEASRVPELQGELQEVTEAKEREKQRADELQAIQDKEAAQTELVKERLFDLERSVEMADWSERKLAKENEGLQGLISRNRKRFQKELARLTVASAELEDKTAALKDVESALAKEKKTVKELSSQVTVLKERAEVMAAELSATRDKLAKETARRINAENAVRQATDKSYVEQLKKADATLEQARLEGKAAVEEVQTLLSEEKKSWDTERSTLSTRLEEALSSTEAYSAKVKELEKVAEQLRTESTQSKAETEELRSKLQVSEKTSEEAAEEKKRLLMELESTKGVAEERNRLQQRQVIVANLKATLQKLRGKQGDEKSDGKEVNSNNSSNNNGAELEGAMKTNGATLEAANERLSKTAASLS
ncbi:unnamed protein product, partial [Hapterophycus canaliculatus]